MNTIFPHHFLALYLLSLCDFKISCLKNLLIISLLSCVFSSCSIFKKSTGGKTAAAPVRQTSPNTAPVFIDNISIKSDKKEAFTPLNDSIEVPQLGYSTPLLLPENYHELQFKYAILLDVAIEELTDQKLLGFLESWYGTRYRMGGVDQSGVDCSAFVQSFMNTMYGLFLPRTSATQYSESQRISKKELQEGDLVFFRTQRRRGVSHVGVYLRNNKFVHASTSSGVMISDLSEPYFSSRYVGAGRYRNSAAAEGSH